MNMIRPVSDLRNNFADISKTVHETAQPVFLTKNGYGDMVVLSMEAFENLQFESEVYFKLQEAEKEAELTDQRYSSKDVLKAMKDAIGNGLYKLEYLPVARKDMIEIVRYISRELQNPDAADRLAVELVNAAESVLTFPYAAPAYQPIRSLKHEYRKILVQNYLMFYWVDEEERLVTVARVVYAKRDYGRLLE